MNYRVGYKKRDNSLGFLEVPELGYSLEVSTAMPVTQNLLDEIKKALKKASPEAFVWDDLVNKMHKAGEPIIHRLHWGRPDGLLYGQVDHFGRCAIKTSVLQELQAQELLRYPTDTSSALWNITKRNSKGIHYLKKVFRFVGEETNHAYKIGRKRLPQPEKKASSVSIIINYRDKPELTQNAVVSISKQEFDGKIELILVNNQSTQVTQTVVKKGVAKALPNVEVKYLDYDHPYNHSAQCNLGASVASGEVLLFLNNDAELEDADTLEQLSSWALQPGVATVGPRILGNKRQLISSGVQVFAVEKSEIAEGFGIKEVALPTFASAIRETAGNSFACAAIARETWNLSGGLDEKEFPHQFNDAEFVLRLLKQGLKHLYIGQVVVRHQPGSSKQESKDVIRNLRKALSSRYPDLGQYREIGPEAIPVDAPIAFDVPNKVFMKSLGAIRKLAKVAPEASEKLGAAAIRTRRLFGRVLPQVFGNPSFELSGT